MSDALRNKLLALLSTEDLNSITDASSEVAFAQGDVLQKEGRSITTIYFPLSGMISFLVVLKGGRTVETCVVGREGMMGARAGLGPDTSRIRAVAQLPLRALATPAEHFRKLAITRPAMADLCLRNTDVILDQTRITAACTSFHGIEARFCRWILHTADRAESDQFILQQSLLSEMLGVRRTSVSDVANALQKKGIIAYSRGRMQLLNRNALQGLSCECYALLNRNSS